MHILGDIENNHLIFFISWYYHVLYPVNYYFLNPDRIEIKKKFQPLKCHAWEIHVVQFKFKFKNIENQKMLICHD